MTPVDTIKSMITAINSDNKEQLLALFAEDAVFENVPLKSVTGKEAIWQVLSPMHDMASQINWQAHRLELGSGGTVFSERSDNYLINGQWITFNCAGIHEINSEGKITLWRDYFDLKQCTDQLGKALEKA